MYSGNSHSGQGPGFKEPNGDLEGSIMKAATESVKICIDIILSVQGCIHRIFFLFVNISVRARSGPKRIVNEIERWNGVHAGTHCHCCGSTLRAQHSKQTRKSRGFEGPME
jgi:hypothetical protein